jgi:hypothetical protein
MTVTPTQGMDLVSLSQAEIDEIYKTSPVVDIPAGDSKGIAIIVAGSFLTRAITRLTRLFFWRGKVFFPEEGFFLNKLTLFSIRAVKGEIYRGESWFCDGDAIILDYANTTLLLRRVREEVRQVSPGFYLAQVYWGKRRLSNFTLEFEAKED